MTSSTVQDKKLARLSQLLKTLRETTDVTALLEATVPFLAKEMGYSLVWFGLYQSSEDCLLGHEGVSPSSKRLLHQERLRLDHGGLLEQVFFQRRPLHVPDLSQERQAGKWKAIAQDNQIQSTLLFPIHYLDVCYGIVLLGMPEWGMTPQADEIAALSMLCGQLAVALHQAESLRKNQQQKRPEVPLLRLLDELRALPTFEERLQKIVDETHQFIGSSRTFFYCFNPQDRNFWPRLTRQTQGGSPGEVTLAVADCERLYHLLKSDRMLSISDTDSALQAEVSSYLQTQLRVRSLMASPVGSSGHLLGFLATAGLSPHLWSDGEKQYLQGVAQLATLIAPLEQLEDTLGTGQADQAAVAALGSAVRNLRDWKTALKSTAAYLFDRLGLDRLLLVQSQEEGSGFSIVFQHQANRRKLLTGPLTALNALDRPLLDEQRDALMIEDWQSDLRFMQWRSQLAEKAGVRALMLCPVVPGSANTGVLIATSEQPRSWSGTELKLVRDVARQVATLMHQRSLADDMNRLQDIHRALQWGLSALQKEADPDRIDAIAMQAIAQLLKAPWVALLAWSPRDGMAKIAAAYTADGSWCLPGGLVIDSVTEPLLQQLAESGRPLLQSAESLTVSTRQWLTFPQLKQLLGFNLIDPTSDIPQGAILIGESHRRPWSKRAIELTQLLVQQLSWSRRSARRMIQSQTRQGQLEQLNWYKQFCGEHFQMGLTTELSRLKEDEVSLSLASRQALEKLETTVEAMGNVFHQEQWDLKIHAQTTPLIRLLKQAKQQLDPLISARQLWCQFHWSDIQHFQIQGDALKLSGIIQSLLVTACQRCLLGGRLDVWCQPQPDNRLEFSITDNGMLDPLLLAALQPDADSADPVLQAVLEENPGLSLRLSQALIQQMGGAFEIQSLEDGRTVSRLLIPGLLFQ